MEKFTASECKGFINSPYDLYCLSVQPLLSSRTCSECGLHFATKIKIKKHNIVHKKMHPRMFHHERD